MLAKQWRKIQYFSRDSEADLLGCVCTNWIAWKSLCHLLKLLNWECLCHIQTKEGRPRTSGVRPFWGKHVREITVRNTVRLILERNKQASPLYLLTSAFINALSYSDKSGILFTITLVEKQLEWVLKAKLGDLGKAKAKGHQNPALRRCFVLVQNLELLKQANTNSSLQTSLKKTLMQLIAFQMKIQI